MEEAAVAQTIRNWKLLSDLKETASSVHIKGEEAGRDFSIFSRQNLYTRGKGLPAYERLINRISFNNLNEPLHLQTHFLSLVKFGYSQKSAHSLTSNIRTRLIVQALLFIFCVLIALLIVLL